MEEAPLNRLIGSFEGQVVAIGTAGAHQPVALATTRTAFLACVAARIMFLQVLARRGWLAPPERFLVTEDEDPHLVHQKVNALYVSGLHQQSPSARRLLSARFGPVPYIGPPLAPIAWIEASCHDNGTPLLLPQGFLQHVLAVKDPATALAGLAPSAADTLPPQTLTVHDECQAELARIAIAARLVQDNPTDQPLPDLSQTVKIGVPPAPLPPEGPTVEYKATFEFDCRTSTRNPAHALATLKTVCAFLNSQGGVLTIGVDDRLNPVGLEGDFSLLKDPDKQDTFENRLREAVKNHIDPLPLGLLNVSFTVHEGFTLCRLTLQPSPFHVTYLLHKDPASGQQLEEVFVRDGNRTLSLKGRKRDQFVLSRTMGPGTIPE